MWSYEIIHFIKHALLFLVHVFLSLPEFHDFPLNNLDLLFGLFSVGVVHLEDAFLADRGII